RARAGLGCRRDERRALVGINCVVNHHVWREQARGNRRRITAIQTDRGRVYDKIDIRDLKLEGALLPRNRLQTRHRSENFGTGKEIAQRISELLSLLESPVRDNQALTVFLRALERDGARRAARAKNEDAHVAQID